MMNKSVNIVVRSAEYCFSCIKHKKDSQVVVINDVKEPSGPSVD